MPAAKGDLNWDQTSENSLSCGGYTATDSTSFQFFLGNATLDNVFYRVTDTVMNTDPGHTQFCLGRVHFPFKTLSGTLSRQDTLPNGLTGYVGLLPTCRRAEIGQLVPCVISKRPSGPNTVLTVQVPALGGDPWARS